MNFLAEVCGGFYLCQFDSNLPVIKDGVWPLFFA